MMMSDIRPAEDQVKRRIERKGRIVTIFVGLLKIHYGDDLNALDWIRRERG